MTATPQGTRAAPGRWWVLVNMTGSLSLIMFNQTAIAVALPSIQRDLDMSTTGVQWVVSAYVLTLGALVPLGGRLGDRFGRRTLFVAGVAVFGVASVIAGAAGSDGTLLWARALQGVGAALMQPASTALIMSTFGPGERGRAMAIYIGVSSSFTAIGPLLGGALTVVFSWRAVLLASVPIAVAALVLTWVVRPPNQPDPSRGLDLRGAVLLTLGLGALVTGVQQGPDWGWSSPATLGCIAGGLVVLALLAVVERTEREPLMALRLFRDPHMAIGSLVVAGTRFALLGVTVFTALYIQDTLGFSPFEAGLAIMPVAVAIIAGTQVGGRLFDRRGARLPLSLGAGLIAAGLAASAPLLARHSYPLLVPGLLVVGVGMGLCSTAVTEALSGIRDAARGQASGMVQTVRQLGGSLGVAAVGAVYVADGLDAAYLLSAVALGLVAAAVLVALPARRPRPREPHPVAG